MIELVVVLRLYPYPAAVCSYDGVGCSNRGGGGGPIAEPGRADGEGSKPLSLVLTVVV